MFENIILNFNWLDAVLALVFVRAIFIGVNQGLVVEMFKTLGMIVSIIAALHFYARLGVWMNETVHLPATIADCLSFLLIWGAGVLAFKFVRDGIFLLFNVEAKKPFGQWSGGIVGMGRAGLISSMILFFVFLTGNQVVGQFAESSLSGQYLRGLAPMVYQLAFDGVIVKFCPEEKSQVSSIEKVAEHEIPKDVKTKVHSKDKKQ